MKSTSMVAASTIALSWFLAGTLFGQAGTSQEPVKGSSPAPASAPASATPAANAAPAASRPRFVPVLISVTDAGGNPIAGLTKEQLTLIDTNQAVQPLQVFKGHDIPLHLGIVLVSAPGSFSQQQAAAANLVQRVIRPNMDEAFVVTARGKNLGLLTAWNGSKIRSNFPR